MTSNMKLKVTIILIGIIVTLLIGFGIYFYKMPYPLEKFYHASVHGPTISGGLTTADYNKMWRLTNDKRSFYELPLEAKKEEDGSIILKTLRYSNDNNAGGNTYLFEKKGDEWALLPDIGGWGRARSGTRRAKTYY